MPFLFIRYSKNHEPKKQKKIFFIQNLFKATKLIKTKTNFVLELLKNTNGASSWMLVCMEKKHLNPTSPPNFANLSKTSTLLPLSAKLNSLFCGKKIN